MDDRAAMDDGDVNDPFETFPQVTKMPSLLGRRFYLFPDQNGATFATVLCAFEGGCRNRENVPIEFEEPDLVGSGPKLIP